MEEVAELLKALAHPTSQQLMVQRDAHVAESRKGGLQVCYRISNPHAYRLPEAVLGAPDLASIAALDGCSYPS